MAEINQIDPRAVFIPPPEPPQAPPPADEPPPLPPEPPVDTHQQPSAPANNNPVSETEIGGTVNVTA